MQYTDNANVQQRSGVYIGRITVAAQPTGNPLVSVCVYDSATNAHLGCTYADGKLTEADVRNAKQAALDVQATQAL